MKLIVLIVFILLDVGLGIYLFSPKTSVVEKQIIVSPTEPIYPINAGKLLALENKWRITDDCQPGGCQPYTQDQRLCAIAKDRVLNDPILDHHEGLLRKYGSYPYVLSENLASADNENQMLEDWLGSEEHAKNLRKPYKYTCIYCSDRYCSQIFSSF
jgi:uncharacterized protein YkwD